MHRMQSVTIIFAENYVCLNQFLNGVVSQDKILHYERLPLFSIFFVANKKWHKGCFKCIGCNQLLSYGHKILENYFALCINPFFKRCETTR
jgi:hypothetical protein